LNAAKDEILWYFDHFDRDAWGEIKQGKKDVRQFDLNVIELLWLFKYLWGSLVATKEKQLVKLGTTVPKLYERLNSYVETFTNEVDIGKPEKEIAQEFLQCFKGTPIEDDFQDIRMNWRRFEIFTGLNPKLNVSLLASLGKMFEELCRVTEWIDSFDELVLKNSSLKRLFYKQSILFEHTKIILEEEGHLLKHIVSIGMLAADFNYNSSELWPYEVIFTF
jgi:hypothetical protein